MNLNHSNTSFGSHENSPQKSNSSQSQSLQKDSQEESPLQRSDLRMEKYRINYDMNAVDYLSEVARIVDRRYSHASDKDSAVQELSENEDKEVDSIINQVLNKRRRLSRLANSNVSGNGGSKVNDSGLTMIQIVNKRIKKQNEELANNINKIAKKLKNFKNFNVNENEKALKKNYESISQGSQLIECKQKQLGKLRSRLEKAEKAYSRMELELSKLQQSRRSRKKSQANHNLSKSQNTQYKIIVNCPSCQPKISDDKQKLRTLKVESDFSSPVRKDLYSPIMQFQEYSLKNEPTISLYQNSLQKTSQFGIQLPPQVCHQSTQVEMKLNELINQENELDEQILKLETQIRKNNNTISRYESLLIKQVI